MENIFCLHTGGLIRSLVHLAFCPAKCHTLCLCCCCWSQLIKEIKNRLQKKTKLKTFLGLFSFRKLISAALFSPPFTLCEGEQTVSDFCPLDLSPLTNPLWIWPKIPTRNQAQGLAQITRHLMGQNQPQLNTLELQPPGPGTGWALVFPRHSPEHWIFCFLSCIFFQFGRRRLSTGTRFIRRSLSPQQHSKVLLIKPWKADNLPLV